MLTGFCCLASTCILLNVFLHLYARNYSVILIKQGSFMAVSNSPGFEYDGPPHAGPTVNCRVSCYWGCCCAVGCCPLRGGRGTNPEKGFLSTQNVY
jgi:hypothetical protein